MITFLSCILRLTFGEAHKDLVEQAGILHRDISVNNVMMYRADSADTQLEGAEPRDAPLPKGLLIDFDYATFLKEKNEVTHSVQRMVRHPSKHLQ